MARAHLSAPIVFLGSLVLAVAGLGAVAAPVSALPAPPPPPWPAIQSQVPDGVWAIQVALSGGRGGGTASACQITSSHRVRPGQSVNWILGADGVDGTVSSGGAEPGGAGGAGAYGYLGAPGGVSASITGAKSGGGGGGASAFEVNGETRVVAGGTGGSAAGYSGPWPAGSCSADGSSGHLSADMSGGGVRLASCMTDVVAGGLGGSVSGQPGLPGRDGNPSGGEGAGQGGDGGADNASTPWTLGGGGGGGGGYAGGGGGVGSSPGSVSAPGGGGGNMVVPAAYLAAPKFDAGPSPQAIINWVHISGAVLTNARAGLPYTATPTATFGSSDATTPLALSANAWIVDGTGPPLPEGLRLNTRTGEISGRATTPDTYSFILVAAQYIGGELAAFSKATYTITISPATAPEAPRDVVAVAGDRSATVTFAKPASNGGARISRYAVTAQPGGARCIVEMPAPLACTVGGLDNGTSYTFTVVAKNSPGTSVPSEPSPSVIPRAARQRQIVNGVPLPTTVSQTEGTVLLKRATYTSSGESVRVKVTVEPLVRARPAGDLDLYRMVTGVNGSKTLYITTSQPVSVEVVLYAHSSPGYFKWSKSRTYAI